jgi:hypothetical protein
MKHKSTNLLYLTFRRLKSWDSAAIFLLKGDSICSFWRIFFSFKACHMRVTCSLQRFTYSAKIYDTFGFDKIFLSILHSILKIDLLSAMLTWRSGIIFTSKFLISKWGINVLSISYTYFFSLIGGRPFPFFGDWVHPTISFFGYWFI